MNITDVITPVIALGGMGALLGAGLGFAATKLSVEEDPLVSQIRDALPGANCGGCGYSGCDAFAEVLAKKEDMPQSCAVISEDNEKTICGLLGLPFGKKTRMAAYIRCGGCASQSAFRYEYNGAHCCKAAMQLAAGGSKECRVGCLGGGSCIGACKFGAITEKDGISVIDNEKCTACGSCVKACPKKLIVMVPYAAKTRVNCATTDAGKEVRKNCKVGCIACKLCEKACEFGAIEVVGNLAEIDYDKCTQCGKCAAKCPSKCIVFIK